MSKHSSGTWIVYGGGKRRRAVGRAGGGYCICQLTRNAEEAANARLIAAAPDLLETLRELVREADRKGGRVREVSRYEVDRARAAIAKAEGGGT